MVERTREATDDTTEGRIRALDRRHDEAVVRADARAREKQHAKGKLSARERIEQLVDEGSFVELDELALHRNTAFGADERRLYGDGVVTGHGTIHGRQVCLFSQDFTIFGGSMGEACGEKVLKVQDLAMKIGCPIIGIMDSGGARIQEGVVSLAYYAENGKRHTQASGVIPQISLIMGPCAGGAAYSPAITDFIVMVDETSRMFVTGPDVVRAVTGEDVTSEQLGGARMNSTVSGNAHYLAADEPDALDWVRALLAYLPENNLEPPPAYPPPAEPGPVDELDSVIPDSPNAGYDVHRVLELVLDDGDYLEIQQLFAPQMVCAFGRIEGRTVGVVANQPMVSAGTIDIDAAEKAARFVRFCDAFNVPILTFVDVPGFMPGTAQEQLGMIRRGAKLTFAYSESTVPKVTVVLRKAYGGGYAIMGSKHLGADVNLAWPTAEIAVMGATGAVEILYRKEITEAAANGTEDSVRAKLIEEYRNTLATPYIAAERGYVDAVIRPARTREHVRTALRMLATKRQETPAKKHGNIPL